MTGFKTALSDLNFIFAKEEHNQSANTGKNQHNSRLPMKQVTSY
jgi:hypothetical protein